MLRFSVCNDDIWYMKATLPALSYSWDFPNAVWYYDHDYHVAFIQVLHIFSVNN